MHDQLIEELIQLFTQLPNHSVQRIYRTLLLTGTNAKDGNYQSWGSKELESMSKDQLRDLIKEKRVLLNAEKVKYWWVNRNS
ncbi:hypothetical protein G3570_00740 [Balneolaceae bacterium YR4-1]|uniref:Uncharacterized protein n=1 Tax=Halalkalibaculum roseum TaxID=2709311 RepID=A0A6M1SIG1_9BACT|nr:hypothetical protein [Halalkalibaculum roseum]NGP75141.1 hypothetical protein [Halalkalibaculum roseum]